MLLYTFERQTGRRRKAYTCFGAFVCDTCSKHYKRRYSTSLRNSADSFCCRSCVNTGRRHSQEWKVMMAARNTGEANPFFGRKHSAEYCRVASQARQGISWDDRFGHEVAEQLRAQHSRALSGENNPFYGRKHTDEACVKISRSHRSCKGELNPMYGQGHKISGLNNGAWNGGTSLQGYEGFSKRKRELIRARDAYTCVLCLKPGRDVHHIDYDKANGDDANLITLCRSCHVKTNGHRQMWMMFLRRLIDMREE